MVFYKLTYSQYEDFKNGKTIAIPEKDPYNLFPLAVAQQFDRALQYTYQDLKQFTYDFLCLKDKFCYRYYIMASLFKDIV